MDETRVVPLLRGLGLLREGEDAQVEALAGGVSSDVWRVRAEGRTWIVKHPLARFRVESRWEVSTRRAVVEHAFVRALSPFLPAGSLAPIVAFAPAVPALVLEAAPEDWTSWKSRLLAGDVATGPPVASAAGTLLAQVHAAGDHPLLRGRFRHDELFAQQRLDPYLRSVARTHPGLAAPLQRVERMLTTRSDLVHGDFSPKNLLTDGRALWLIDHEVATRADAAFDVAFLLTHLLLKSIHRPMDQSSLKRSAEAFLAAYGRPVHDPQRVLRAWSYVGALLLARVVGKSPVEYLTETGRRRAWSLGTRWLHTAPRDVASAWAQAAGASAV